MTNYVRALWYLYSLQRHGLWSPEKLRNYQNKMVKRTIEYAYRHVPFYHDQLNKMGIAPSEIKAVQDLARLPVISKDEIRNNLQSMISQEYTPERLKMRSTSGSTGKPLFFYVSQDELEFRKAKHLRANISCGQKAFDHWATITAPHHFAESTGLQRVVGLYSPRPISVFDDVAKQVSLAEGIRPDILDGYSSALYLFARELERKPRNKIKPRFIIGGAELIDDSSREFIETTLCAPFYDQYSSVEMERMAWQCPCRQGYHIDADAMVIQIVDKRSEDVSLGESGEIICTSLFNKAMPFIRYAIGDIGVFSADRCDCGRPFPMMKVIEGRKDSLILLPDGRMIAPRTFTIAMNSFKFYSQIDQFRIVQEKRDLFRFVIKMKEPFVEEEKFRSELESHFRRMLGLVSSSVAFEFELVDSIPLDRSGKLMAVMSRVRKTNNV
jgi:phenylacetate-CoA ligase